MREKEMLANGNRYYYELFLAIPHPVAPQIHCGRVVSRVKASPGSNPLRRGKLARGFGCPKQGRFTPKEKKQWPRNNYST
jgi:hypothetical protein